MDEADYMFDLCVYKNENNKNRNGEHPAAVRLSLIAPPIRLTDKHQSMNRNERRMSHTRTSSIKAKNSNRLAAATVISK